MGGLCSTVAAPPSETESQTRQSRRDLLRSDVTSFRFEVSTYRHSEAGSPIWEELAVRATMKLEAANKEMAMAGTEDTLFTDSMTRFSEFMSGFMHDHGTYIDAIVKAELLSQVKSMNEVLTVGVADRTTRSDGLHAECEHVKQTARTQEELVPTRAGGKHREGEASIPDAEDGEGNGEGERASPDTDVLGIARASREDRDGVEQRKASQDWSDYSSSSGTGSVPEAVAELPFTLERVPSTLVEGGETPKTSDTPTPIVTE